MPVTSGKNRQRIEDSKRSWSGLLASPQPGPQPNRKQLVLREKTAANHANALSEIEGNYLQYLRGYIPGIYPKRVSVHAKKNARVQPKEGEPNSLSKDNGN